MKILIIGKIPPPIGGVTIHIKRFIEHLKKDNLNYILLDYSKKNNLLKLFRNYDLAHIHVSNKKLRFFLLLILMFLRKKTVVTFHGKYDFTNKWDRFSLRLSTKNLILNDYSKNRADKLSSNNKLIGAFIPPLRINESLDVHTINDIQKFIAKFSVIYCMNASNFVLDHEGNEIYMGTEIINFFKLHSELGLIFSDPSGSYSAAYDGFASNVLFVNTVHEFVDIFKYSDYLIRYTTTDGDSLSVKEALYFNLPVFASNCVERPESVIIIDKLSDVLTINHHRKTIYIKKPENSYSDIINVYKEILQ